MAARPERRLKMSNNKEFLALKFERFDAKQTILDVTEYYERGKLKLDFLKYGQDNKQQARIGIFLSPGDALVLALNILMGKIGKMLKNITAQKEAGILDEKKFGYTNLWASDIGGTAGKGRYREMVIQPGMKPGTYCLVAQEGPGAEDAKGLIQPKGAPDTYIRMPMNRKQLYKFAFALIRDAIFCDIHMFMEFRKKKAGENTNLAKLADTLGVSPETLVKLVYEAQARDAASQAAQNGGGTYVA